MPAGTTIRVSHSSHGAGNSPMALGVAQGFFADAGLDVQMREVPKTSEAVERLGTGTTEFAVAGSVPILNHAVAGGDPVIVMSIEAENVFAVIGARGIESPEQLRGATIGITGHRDQDGMMIRRALREWDIDPETEVTLVELGSRGQVWDALVRGDIAAMTATIPQPILARSIGLPILKDYLDTPQAYQVGSIVTTRRFADANRDLVRTFLAAQLRSVRLFQQDFDAAMPHVRARSKIADVEVLRETNRLFGEALNHYVPEPAALAAVVRDLEAAFGQPLAVDVNAIVDPSFATGLDSHPAASAPRNVISEAGS